MKTARWLGRLYRRLSAAHAVTKCVIAAAMSLAVGYLDYASGDELSFSIVYLLPIGYAAWFIGAGAGMFAAAACATIWFFVDLVHSPPYSSPLIPVWNTGVRFGFFVLGVAAAALARKVQRQLYHDIWHRTRSLRAEIARRRQLEREMVEVSAREHVRMARDLHDGMGQYLSALSFHAQTLVEDLRQQNSPSIPQAEKLVHVIRATNHITRQLDRALRIPTEASGDFVTAIRGLVGDSQQLTGVRCEIAAPSQPLIFDDFRTVMLFRIVQEAVNNAIKHANPRLVRVTLEVDDDVLKIRIQDDGHSFILGSSDASGSGIRAMKLRADLIGARFGLARTESGGCCVACTVPLVAQGPQGDLL